ncbi:MAG: hypothetical protein ACKODX_22280 [Gemmata sp.]|jgi:hypothetical protein
MATFYLLPPRECLDRAVTDLCAKLLPGLPLPADAWGAFAEHLAAAGGWAGNVFLVPRDELPDGAPGGALADCYGAEPGDRVVEVSLARPSREWAVAQPDISGAGAAR